MIPKSSSAAFIPLSLIKNWISFWSAESTRADMAFIASMYSGSGQSINLQVGPV
jgi:hypothetical protein